MRRFIFLLALFLPMIGKAYLQFEKTYVCVSFSMPNETLKTLFQQATVEGATLVIRGLYKNSFQETRRKLEEVGINVTIDPTIFEAFGVEAVPTVIGIHNSIAHKVSGNVPLRTALDHIRPEGER